MRIYVVRKQSDIICVESDILLKASVFVVKMICASYAMLFLPCQAIFTAPADTTCKSDADKLAYSDIVGAVRAEGDDTSNALMATNVRKLDVGYRLAIKACGCAFFGMEI